jgi:hypothetical protein
MPQTNFNDIRKRKRELGDADAGAGAAPDDDARARSLRRKATALRAERDSLAATLEAQTQRGDGAVERLIAEVAALRAQAASLRAFKARAMPFLEDLAPAFTRLLGALSGKAPPQAGECVRCLGTAVALAAAGHTVAAHHCDVCGMQNAVCDKPGCVDVWARGGAKCMARCGTSIALAPREQRVHGNPAPVPRALNRQRALP